MEASATMEVGRPVAEVFAFVSNPEHMDRWVVGASDTRHVSGEGRDVRYARTHASGRETEMVWEVTRLDPPREVRMGGEGPVPFEGRLTLDPTDRGTRLTNTIDAGSDSTYITVVFTLFRPVVRRMMARQLREELETLKEVLETEPSSVSRSTEH